MPFTTWKELSMTRISIRRRLWLVAAALAVAAAAATLAFAHGQNHASAPAHVRAGVDDTRPVGPSDPQGLSGVPVPNR
jgi:hypothetical protein